MTSRHCVYSYLRAFAALLLAIIICMFWMNLRMKRKVLFPLPRRRAQRQKRESIGGERLNQIDASQSAMARGQLQLRSTAGLQKQRAAPVCPACGETSRDAALEQYAKYKLFGCGACGLQFWEPREMPTRGGTSRCTAAVMKGCYA